MKKLSFYILIFIGILFLQSCGANNSKTTYQVSLSAIPQKGGTVLPESGQYKEGAKVNVLAKPSGHWKFDHWSGDLEGTNGSVTITVAGPMNIKAHFSKTKYDLTIHTKGEGTVQQKVIQMNASTIKNYEYGTKVQLTAKPAKGWEFVKWTGDLSGSETPTEITVKNPKEITAVFQRKDYQLTVNVQGKGTVEQKVIASKAGSTRDYKFGTLVELTAIPDSGWKFVKWTGDLTGTENPDQLRVKGPKQVTAVFKEKPKNATFHLASNGVTVICTDAKVGDKGTIAGVLYTKRTAGQITPANAATTCTSGITDMSKLFQDSKTFNGDIDSWDVSSVTDFSYMFDGASAFNQDLNNWDVSNAKTMRNMFWKASIFNGDISDWDVSGVTNMHSMFNSADSFNGDIGGWDVSNVTDTGYMFYRASAFNQSLNDWDVSNVATMHEMFARASSFNQTISSWDVGNVTDMAYMFYVAASFNQPLDSWDVGQVTTMYLMFGKTNYNQDLNSWDVGQVENMRAMFWLDPAFNGDISSWDVSSVTNMHSMFNGASSFNQDIGGWDVSGVTDMGKMFNNSSAFNQDLTDWCVSNITSLPADFADGSALQSDFYPVWGTCPAK